MLFLFLYIIFPLIISNVIHIIIVKKNYFSTLATPISKKLFGDNKTWRGFVVVPVLNALVFMCINFWRPNFSLLQGLGLGLLLGIAYVLFELPNSLVKRKVGIAPGAQSVNNRFLFMLVDKADSSLGVSIFSYFLFQLSCYQTSALLLSSILVHSFFSFILLVAGIKKQF